MSEWKEYKLIDITEPVKETYIPDGSEDLNYIGLEHIEQGSLRLNSIGKSRQRGRADIHYRSRFAVCDPAPQHN